MNKMTKYINRKIHQTIILSFWTERDDLTTLQMSTMSSKRKPYQW